MSRDARPISSALTVRIATANSTEQSNATLPRKLTMIFPESRMSLNAAPIELLTAAMIAVQLNGSAPVRVTAFD
jgi:hypothetical protein